MTNRPAFQHPPWFAHPRNRLRILDDLRATATTVVVARPSAVRRGGFATRCALTPTGLPPQHVTIEFGRNDPHTPHIFVPGPGSPHRYDDGSLCIWFPWDPPSQRWTWRDGGRVLAGHICAHLIRETWWRQTGEWVGDEVPHD